MRILIGKVYMSLTKRGSQMDKNVREKEALYHLELSGTEDIKKSFTEVECEF